MKVQIGIITIIIKPIFKCYDGTINIMKSIFKCYYLEALLIYILELVLYNQQPLLHSAASSLTAIREIKRREELEQKNQIRLRMRAGTDVTHSTAVNALFVLPAEAYTS